MAQHPQDVRRWFKILLPERRENMRLFEELNCPRYVPWELIEAHSGQCMKNHSQSVETLDVRGGLDPSELCAVLEDRPWKPMPYQLAVATVQKLLAQYAEAAAV